MKNNKVNLLAFVLALAVSACGSKGSDDDADQPNNPPTMNNMTNTTSTGSGGSTGSMNDPMNNDNTGGKPSTSGGAGMGDANNGTGGNDAMMMGNAGMGGSGTGGMGGSMMNDGAYPDPRGKCDINSGFPDDHACLLPPDPKEGMQIHIGPSDYNNPDEINKFIFHPGTESSECVSFHTPNDEEIYYQTFELSGRAGTHHIINTMYNIEVDDGGGYVACLDPGTGTNANIVDNLPGASKAYMARTLVAPEYKDVGRKIGPHTPSQADEHYFNFTEDDIIREFWMNIYFVPKDQVKREASQIRGMGGLSWTALPIPPGTDMVYQYSCPIDKDGAIIQLLGHYHSHGKRFTAYVTHADATRDKVFEMYDYLDPKTYQYDSITMNPMFSDNAGGATSGVLNVKAGDSLDWECHIINDGDVALSYTNEVKTGEMCNLWGESLGPVLNCVIF
jgi:hypothetical protein